MKVGILGHQLIRPLLCCCLAVTLAATPTMSAEQGLSAAEVAKRVRNRGTAERVKVRLNDGNTYEGQLTAADEEMFTATLYRTTVSRQRPGQSVSTVFGDVAEFDSNRRVKVQLNNGRVIKGSVCQISQDNFLLVERNTGQPVSIAYDEVTQFSKPTPGWGRAVQVAVYGSLAALVIVAIWAHQREKCCG